MSSALGALKSLVKGGAVVLGVVGAGIVITNPDVLTFQLRTPRVVPFLDQVPSRQEQLKSLSEATASKPYDVLIIGGGATGTGCAVDAATRWVLVQWGRSWGLGTPLVQELLQASPWQPN